MEFIGLKKTGICFGIGEIFSLDCIWMVATQVPDILFRLVFMENKKKQKISSYCRHGNNTLPDNTKYNTQCYDDKKKFMWGNSSELKSEDTEGPVSGGLHVTNKLTLNDVKLVCLERHM